MTASDISPTHIASGAEIAITTRWPRRSPGTANPRRLRIPLTAGQVYGRSRLAYADALESGGANGLVEVAIHRASGRIILAGFDLVDGRAQVPLNRPSTLRWSAETPTLRVGAGGHAIALQIAPLPAGRDTLDLAILVDRSGSMGETGGAAGRGATSMMP